MSATKLNCPRCQATLKMPPNVPAGFKPKCPRCGTAIMLPGRNGTGAPPSIAGRGKAGAPSFRAAGVSAASAVGRSVSPGGDVPEDTLPGERRIGLVATLGLIFGGGLVLLALTAGLLLLCFQGETKKSDSVKNEGLPDQPGPASPQVEQVPPAPKAKKAAAKALIVLSAAEQANVDAATKRGVEFLKQRQIQDGELKGAWKPNTVNMEVNTLGFTALAGLTLLECDVSENDAAVRNAAQFVRQRVRNRYQNETYQVALSILFLSRLNDGSDRPLIRSLALRLVAMQWASGGWGYASPPLNEHQEQDVLALLTAWPSSSGRGAAGSLTSLKMGAFQTLDDFMPPEFYRGKVGETDNSNTQFAVLALWSARRFDLPLDPVLRLVAKRFRNSQFPDGSWRYEGARNVSGNPTMTAAGLLGLAVGYGVEKDDKADVNLVQDEVLQKGFKELSLRVGDPGQDPARIPEMYFLWSVERVAVLYHLEKIEGKDWYRWGMGMVLARQDADGKWFLNHGHAASDMMDTCFALLFLQRANLAKDLTDKLQQLLAALRAPPPKKE